MAAWVLAIASFPVLVPVAALYDALRRTPLTATRVVVLGTWFLTCEVVGLFLAAWIFLAEATLLRGDRTRVEDWLYALERAWATAIFRGAQAIFSFRLVVEPGSDAGRGPLIAFFRHASMADTLLPVLLLTPRGLRLRYVLKHELRFDPCIDVVGHRLPNTFVRRASGDAPREVAAIVRLVDGMSARDAIVIYPEGTRFTQEKRARILARLEASRDAVAGERARRLTNVLPPHLAGPLGLLERNERADALFVAHVGFDGIATFWDLWAGALVGATIRIFAWRVPYAEIPKDREGRIAWLHEHWRRVDAWVGAHRGAARR